VPRWWPELAGRGRWWWVAARSAPCNRAADGGGRRGIGSGGATVMAVAGEEEGICRGRRHGLPHAAALLGSSSITAEGGDRRWRGRDGGGVGGELVQIMRKGRGGRKTEKKGKLYFVGLLEVTAL
jgi:hypothetical protein